MNVDVCHPSLSLSTSTLCSLLRKESTTTQHIEMDHFGMSSCEWGEKKGHRKNDMRKTFRRFQLEFKISNTLKSVSTPPPPLLLLPSLLFLLQAECKKCGDEPNQKINQHLSLYIRKLYIPRAYFV